MVKFNSEQFARDMYQAMHGDGSDKRQPVDFVLIGIVLAILLICS